MPLTTTVSMLRNAQEQGFAVGAFNVENMEMAQAIISAAEELRAPVILQTTPSTVRYAGTGMYAAMVAALAQEATVPVSYTHLHTMAPSRPLPRGRASSQ